jgi:hypothetical protein
MLELVIADCEGCNEFVFTDATKLYNITTNPSGYGSANGVTSPAAFDTYTLSVRFPGTTIEDPADFVFNLLGSVPPIDADENYVWPAITAAQMGLTALQSGVWTFTARGVIAGVPYVADNVVIFFNDLASKFDTAMKEWDPTCGCKDGCEDISELYVQFLSVVCGGKCDPVKAQAIIDSLYTSLPLCC